MTKDRKKLIFWAIAIGLIVYLTKCGGHPMFMMRRAQLQQNMKKNPFPGRGANGQSGGSNSNPQFPPPPPRFVRLGGRWEGSAMVNNRGVCRLQFELQRAPQSQFKGFSKLLCTSVAFLTPGAKPLPRPTAPALTLLNPSSAIMTGKVEGAAIRFTVDQTFNNSPDGCTMKTFALTPFGQDQIATQWTEDNCVGGQMVLQRAQQ